ncbi:MAG: hypothetical protein AAFU65_12065 [Pseudomonadota bacterium]
MNKAISQVVDGSKRAEDAGRQMDETKQHTDALAGSVRDIASSSEHQAATAKELMRQAQEIEKGTAQTRKALSQQATQTKKLLESAHELLTSVGVFTLPEGETQDEPEIEGEVPVLMAANQ